MDFFSGLNKGFVKLIKIFKISFIVICFLFLNLHNIVETHAQNANALVIQLAGQYQINPQLIYSVIHAESSFNTDAVSQCDARGLMQVTRPTWNWITQEYLNVEWDFDRDSFDPVKNIEVGVRFLKWISDYLDKHIEELNDTKTNLMLACYNAGPGAVRNSGFRVPPYEETQNYVRKINNLLH